MRGNQIGDVNIISDTGAIIGGIIYSKHLHRVALASGYLNRHLDQMGCWL